MRELVAISSQYPKALSQALSGAGDDPASPSAQRLVRTQPLLAVRDRMQTSWLQSRRCSTKQLVNRQSSDSNAAQSVCCMPAWQLQCAIGTTVSDPGAGGVI